MATFGLIVAVGAAFALISFLVISLILPKMYKQQENLFPDATQLHAIQDQSLAQSQKYLRIGMLVFTVMLLIGLILYFSAR